MMKRELGIARCGLACCLCSEMAVIRITVLTMPGAKTEDAPSRRDSQAVMSVKRTAKEDC